MALPRAQGWVLGLCLAISPVVTASMAQDAPFQTDIINLSQGSPLSSKAASLADGGYELAGGKWQSFTPWYNTQWPGTRVDFLTTMSPDFGLLWGLSSGESAPKYRIAPSVRIGILARLMTFRAANLMLTATSDLGGEMTEYPCTADYGDIGGVQQVNCRLAATILDPADTLAYLIHDHPARIRVVFSFSGTF